MTHAEDSTTVRYTGSRKWSAEGARVGLITCLRCGSSLLIDPADEQSVIGLHDAWHDHITANLTEATL